MIPSVPDDSRKRGTSERRGGLGGTSERRGGLDSGGTRGGLGSFSVATWVTVAPCPEKKSLIWSCILVQDCGGFEFRNCRLSLIQVERSLSRSPYAYLQSNNNMAPWSFLWRMTRPAAWLTAKLELNLSRLLVAYLACRPYQEFPSTRTIFPESGLFETNGVELNICFFKLILKSVIAGYGTPTTITMRHKSSARDSPSDKRPRHTAKNTAPEVPRPV